MKAACLTLVALTVLPLGEDSPSLKLEAGDMTSCSWTVEVVTEVVESKLSLMGNDQNMGTGSTSTRTLQLDLSDEHAEVRDDGSPLQFARSYEEVALSLLREGGDSDGEDSDDGDRTSVLSGETVIFTYDEDSEEWSRTFDEDSDGDDEDIEGLEPRMDLVRLLPTDDVEVGSTWDVDPMFLADVLRPGGPVMIEESDESEIDEDTIHLRIPGNSDIDRFDEFYGTLSAVFEEIVEEDDLRLAKIIVEIGVRANMDIADDLEALAEERHAEEIYSDATLERNLEGTITVLWNLEANRPESLNAELSGDHSLAAEWAVIAGQNELPITVLNESDVTYEISATFGD